MVTPQTFSPADQLRNTLEHLSQNFSFPPLKERTLNKILDYPKKPQALTQLFIPVFHARLKLDEKDLFDLCPSPEIFRERFLVNIYTKFLKVYDPKQHSYSMLKLFLHCYPKGSSKPSAIATKNFPKLNDLEEIKKCLSEYTKYLCENLDDEQRWAKAKKLMLYMLEHADFSLNLLPKQLFHVGTSEVIFSHYPLLLSAFSHVLRHTIYGRFGHEEKA